MGFLSNLKGLFSFSSNDQKKGIARDYSLSSEKISLLKPTTEFSRIDVSQTAARSQQVLIRTLQDNILRLNSAVQLFEKDFKQGYSKYNYDAWQRKFVREIILKYKSIIETIEKQEFYAEVGSSSTEIKASLDAAEKLSLRLIDQKLQFDPETINAVVQKNLVVVKDKLRTFQNALSERTREAMRTAFEQQKQKMA